MKTEKKDELREQINLVAERNRGYVHLPVAAGPTSEERVARIVREAEALKRKRQEEENKL